jgi:hypothetical protein
MKRPDWRHSLGDYRFWLLWAALQLPAWQPLYKYLPAGLHPLIPLYFLGWWGCYRLVLYSPGFHAKTLPIWEGRWTLIILLVGLASINYFVYPIADALKLQMRGSDQDDALILAGSRLVRLLSPYAEKTYLGNPISTGPGLVLLTLPFILCGTYFLLTPASLGALAWMVRRRAASPYRANLLIFLCLSSLGFWQAMVVGSDLFLIGTLFVLTLALLYFKAGRSQGYFSLGIILFSLSATSRLIFIYLVPLVSVFLGKRNQAQGIIFFAAATLMTVALHVLFYLWDPAHYTPLHILSKGTHMLPGVWMLLAGLLCMLAGLISIYQVSDEFTSWLWYMGICLFTPMICIAMGELAFFRGFNFTNWEVAQNLMVTLPALTAYAALQAPDFRGKGQ